MKYHKFKDMALGAMVATLIVGAVPIAYGKVADTMIPVSYNSIKVLVDGKELKTDKEPFTYDGTTYLPVRAVAEAVGKEVKWDSATKTVTLSEATTDAKSDTQTEPVAADPVLYNSNGIKITYKGTAEGKFGKDINLLIENSTNKDYTVQVRDFSVNGYMVDPIFSCDVTAGKKANDEITITSSYLKDNSILDVKEFEANFYVFESDTWSNSFDSGKISFKVK
ncbi:copper amine oxidase N-terminal domain-containing protein [Anaerotignum sp.]|uniref:copper amine oxidase N-terminal domain-containing protein n=1 Tax=Anaerotignum sp. TaxID=2039241 RepID=UPI00332654C2